MIMYVQQDREMRQFAVASRGVVRMTTEKRAYGFTLIELMIVVAVVAILAAIAYPNFSDSVRKSRRGQAKADMVEVAQILERFHTVNNSYVLDAATKAGLPTQSPKKGTARYDIAISGESQSAFLITATPKTGQDKDICGTMTINQAGAKTPTTAECWN